MYCKRCGKEVDDDARFCSSCGTALPATKISRSTTAPSPLQHEAEYVKAEDYEDTSKLMVFIKSCWHGEKSLAFSFWVLLVGIEIVFRLIATTYTFLYWIDWLATQGTFWILPFLASILALSLWQLVSVWRSASRYTGWKGWKYMAYGALILFTCLPRASIANTITMAFGPVLFQRF